MSKRSVKVSDEVYVRITTAAERDRRPLSAVVGAAVELYEELAPFRTLIRQWAIRDLIDSGVQWYARGGGIEECGPFATASAAVRHMRTTEGRLPDGFAVWPVEAT